VYDNQTGNIYIFAKKSRKKIAIHTIAAVASAATDATSAVTMMMR